MLQSSSECSDAHHILELVEQLDVDEDERPVTVIVMATAGEDGLSKYLLQIIAGHLKEPIVRPTNELWRDIQTHYVGNDSLYEEIIRRCDDGLQCLKPEKREKLVSEGSSFVVTSSFPIINIDGEFRITDVIQATVGKVTDDNKEVYIFSAGESLSLEVQEPRSPPSVKFKNGQIMSSGNIDVKVCTILTIPLLCHVTDN